MIVAKFEDFDFYLILSERVRDFLEKSHLVDELNAWELELLWRTLYMCLEKTPFEFMKSKETEYHSLDYSKDHDYESKIKAIMNTKIDIDYELIPYSKIKHIKFGKWYKYFRTFIDFDW